MSIDVSMDYERYPTFAPIPGAGRATKKSYHHSKLLYCRSKTISIVLNKKSIHILRNAKVISSNGTWGEYRERYCQWRGITAIAGGYDHVLALSKDGTVHTSGDNRYCQQDVQNWSNIISIAAGGYHSIGVCSDGTVKAVGYNKYGQCNVRDWTDIIDVQSSAYHTVGLCSDGTVLATGRNDYGQCHVQNWTDIISIAVGELHTVGLRADGTVLATGCSRNGRCNVGSWSKIRVIAAGKSHTVGLRGWDEVLAVGSNTGGKCRLMRMIEQWKKKEKVESYHILEIGAGTDYTIAAVEHNYDITIISNNDFISSCFTNAFNFRD